MKAHPYYPHTTQREAKGVQEVQIHKPKVKTQAKSHPAQVSKLLIFLHDKEPKDIS